MTKKKTENKPMYVSYNRRNEVNGAVYERNEITDLKDMSDEQIIAVLKMGYYGILNPETLPKNIAEAIELES